MRGHITNRKRRGVCSRWKIYDSDWYECVPEASKIYTKIVFNYVSLEIAHPCRAAVWAVSIPEFVINSMKWQNESIKCKLFTRIQTFNRLTAVAAAAAWDVSQAFNLKAISIAVRVINSHVGFADGSLSLWQPFLSLSLSLSVFVRVCVFECVCLLGDSNRSSLWKM